MYDTKNMVYGPPIAKAAGGEAIATVAHSQTRVVEVYMAGDCSHAKQIVRRYCKDSPTCVTVSPTTFIYRGGEESGFVIGFRNYPRFPSDAYSLRRAADELAELIRGQTGQDSYMVVDAHGQTTWRSDRNA